MISSHHVLCDVKCVFGRQIVLSEGFRLSFMELRNDCVFIRAVDGSGRDVDFLLLLQLSARCLRLWCFSLQKLFRHVKRGSSGGWRFTLESEVCSRRGGSRRAGGKPEKPGCRWVTGSYTFFYSLSYKMIEFSKKVLIMKCNCVLEENNTFQENVLDRICSRSSSNPLDKTKTDVIIIVKTLFNYFLWFCWWTFMK